MRHLTQSVALALPRGCELEALAAAVSEARCQRRTVEVRIGVGAIEGAVPLRVLGHAVCVADAVRRDAASAVRKPDAVAIFSSAAKAGIDDGESALLALAALAGALVLAGVEAPISLDLADAADEVWPHLVPALPASLMAWLERAARHSGNQAPALRYAVEHAAASMFGDIVRVPRPPLRITVGSTPEARFWAVRTRVREEALRRGREVAPALGLILKSLRVPWYYALTGEPELSMLLSSQAAALAALDQAANPLQGGNAGLSREARATRRLAALPGALELASIVQEPHVAARWVQAQGFLVGERLAPVMRRLA